MWRIGTGPGVFEQSIPGVTSVAIGPSRPMSFPAPMSETTADPPSLTVLRAAWRPLNDAHKVGRRFSDGVHLRLYRCLSWADRAETIADEDPDLAFILRMIALNALWGRAFETVPDGLPAPPRPNQQEDFRRFLARVVEHDSASRVLDWMRAREDLLAIVFGSRFFHREWWKDPEAGDLRGQDRIAEKFPGWLERGEIDRLAGEFARRMLLLRGQLMHGNATHGGKTNRPSVEPAAEVLDGVLRSVLAVLILDGVLEIDLDWMPVPYPPTSIDDESPADQSSSPSDEN